MLEILSCAYQFIQVYRDYKVINLTYLDIRIMLNNKSIKYVTATYLYTFSKHLYLLELEKNKNCINIFNPHRFLNNYQFFFFLDLGCETLHHLCIISYSVDIFQLKQRKNVK